MKRKDLLSYGEQRALELLERSLLGRGRVIYVRLPLRHLIQPDPGEALSRDEARMLRFGEIDFVIVNRDGGFSVELGIEFDPPHHREPAQASRDATKDRLCLQAGLPLFRVTDEAVNEREQTTALEWLAECFWLFKTEQPRLEEQARTMNEGWEELTEHLSPLLGVDITGPATPADALELVNPFPSTVAVKERLRARFGVGTIGENVPLTVTPIHRALVNFQENGRCAWTLCRSGDGEPLYVAHVARRAPQREERGEAFLADRTGLPIAAMDSALADYQVLREIERWAERNLVRIDR